MEIGFIGLGAMGALIVRRLMDAGHDVTGWNRSREKATALLDAGMQWGLDPRDVAQRSDMVLSIVTDAASDSV